MKVPSVSGSRMAGYLSRLSPVPLLPKYSGPHQVGTIDLEIPVADLPAPCPTPEAAIDIHTVHFRVFYPAIPKSVGRSVTWLPAPQRPNVTAMIKFLGVGTVLAEMLSFLPRHVYYAAIPAVENAGLLEPDTPSQRWPVVIFSHGLGGNRNAYSHFAGSLASHGLVVVCPEHRDGSALLSFIRSPTAQHLSRGRTSGQSVPYRRIPHILTPDVYQARESQLRVRLWELGLIHAALVAIDRGQDVHNVHASAPSLLSIAGCLQVHEPGSIVFAGHSFGSATMVQLLKSTFYADYPNLRHPATGAWDPLFVPSADCGLRSQITARTPCILLDMWAFPLQAPNSAPLFDLPLPAYSHDGGASHNDVDNDDGPVGGSAILAIHSETFFKWKEHLAVIVRVLSPQPSAPAVAPEHFDRPGGGRTAEPAVFYVANSAHVSQSDFALLFPRVTRRIFNAEQPTRASRLNLRAMLQMLRVNRVPVARTDFVDLVDGTGDTDADTDADKIDTASSTASSAVSLLGLDHDPAILRRTQSGAVAGWAAIDLCAVPAPPDAADAGPPPDAPSDAISELSGPLPSALRAGAAVHDGGVPVVGVPVSVA